MKILRSVSRRGFSVGTAGWFTVLRPNTWFPASRVPRTFPTYDSGNREANSDALSGAVGAAAWAPVERQREDRNRARLTSAIVGALAITSVMLWWIMHP